MTSPFDATIRAAPLDGPLYAQCACQRTHQLKASGAWAICKCGRAVRFVGELQMAENAEAWARTASLAGGQLADAQAAAVRAEKQQPAPWAAGGARCIGASTAETAPATGYGSKAICGTSTDSVSARSRTAARRHKRSWRH